MKRRKSTGITTESTTSKNTDMKSFDIFAERAKTINSLILETESKELESEFHQLLKDVTSIISDITDNNRKKWLDHGFEPVS
jgi:hypothetical protein